MKAVGARPPRRILLGWLLAVALFVIAGLCAFHLILPGAPPARAELGYWCAFFGVLWTLTMAWVGGVRWLEMSWWLRAAVLLLLPLQGCNIIVLRGVISLSEHGQTQGLQGLSIGFVALGSIVVLLLGGLLAVGVGVYMLMKRTPRWPAVVLITIALLGFSSIVEFWTPEAPEQEPDMAAIRGELELRYEEDRQAFLDKDFDAIMALRTSNFHTVTSDHLVHKRAEMERVTRALLDSTEHWVVLDRNIESVTIDGDLATAVVSLQSGRTALGSDGLVHHVERGGTRQETWRKTPEGWKLYRVEGVRDQLLIDGRLVPGITEAVNGE